MSPAAQPTCCSGEASLELTLLMTEVTVPTPSCSLADLSRGSLQPPPGEVWIFQTSNANGMAHVKRLAQAPRRLAFDKWQL